MTSGPANCKDLRAEAGRTSKDRLVQPSARRLHGAEVAGNDNDARLDRPTNQRTLVGRVWSDEGVGMGTPNGLAPTADRADRAPAPLAPARVRGALTRGDREANLAL